MPNLKKTTIALLVACVIPSAAHAGVLGDLNAVFMSNSTSPGSISTRDRAGGFGGSFSMRTPLKTFNIVAMDPPRLNAGCGGVDLYGGSFTFLNSQQLVQIFRLVASNAAGLAFKAAIKSISPSLDALITEFQALLQNLNNLAKNTCQLAHLIIDPAEKAINNALSADGQIGAVKKGMFDDAIGSLTGYLSDANGFFKKQGEANPRTGNQTVKAILSSGTTNILGLAGISNVDGSADDATNPNSLNNKLLVSLLGYHIVGVPCSSKNEAGTADATSNVNSNNLGRISCQAPATITLDDLFKGGGPNSMRPDSSLTLYACENTSGTTPTNGGFDPQVCSSMLKQTFNYVGVRGWVNQMLLGTADGTSVTADSIVGKYNQATTARLTEGQANFIRQSGIPIFKLLNLTSDANVRVGIAQRLSVYGADCITSRLGEALYKSANGIRYANDYVLSDENKERIRQLQTDYKERQEACLKSDAVLKIVQEINESARINGNVR